MEEDKIRKKQISKLVEAYYNKFDFLQSEDLSELKNKAISRYLDSGLTIEEINNELIKIILRRKQELSDSTNLDNVRENHQKIYKTINDLVNEFNDIDIDYQLAGALCAYLKFGEESKRVHEDIDLSINEDDLDKFENVCEKLGLVYQDKRMDSPRVIKNGIPVGEHEVIAEEPNTDFHIGVFCFQRNMDGSIDNKSYVKDEEGYTCIWNEHLSPALSKLLYGKEYVEINDKKLYITPPEYIYKMKKYTNKYKEKSDIKFMDGKIDMDRLNEIETLSKTDRRVDIIKVNNKLDDMFIKEEPQKEETKQKEQEKPKEYVKTINNLDNKGMVHSRQLVVPFIILILIVLLIELFNIITV